MADLYISKIGGAQAGRAYRKRGHRLFHGLAPYYSFRVPHVLGVYCKTSAAPPIFLSWNQFYATLRAFSGEWSCL
jgi:hypothetical protein